MGLDIPILVRQSGSMKKLSQKQKLHHIRRGRKRNRGLRASYGRKRHRHTRKIGMWYRGGHYTAKLTSNAVVKKFPELMCFRRSPAETLSAFDYVRRKLQRGSNKRLWFKPDIRLEKAVPIRSYISMTDVKEISTSAALVLAAEYERQSMNMDEKAPLFDVRSWDEKLSRKLEQIGFFAKFDYHTDQGTPKGDVRPDVLTVPFYSGTMAKMEEVDQKLLRLVEHIDPEYEMDLEHVLALNSAVGEAATNTREHAYPNDHKFAFPHVGLWWATGAASRSQRKIVVSLYDQGVSIPVSYPKLPAFQKTISALLDLFDTKEGNKYANDAKLIQAATKYGKSGRDPASSTRSNPIGGYGLPQIKEAIDVCGDGSLMILSRAGRYIYEVRNGRASEDLDTFECSIGGTLLEWEVSLPGAVD